MEDRLLDSFDTKFKKRMEEKDKAQRRSDWQYILIFKAHPGADFKIRFNSGNYRSAFLSEPVQKEFLKAQVMCTCNAVKRCAPRASYPARRSDDPLASQSAAPRASHPATRSGERASRPASRPTKSRVTSVLAWGEVGHEGE